MIRIWMNGSSQFQNETNQEARADIMAILSGAMEISQKIPRELITSVELNKSIGSHFNYGVAGHPATFLSHQSQRTKGLALI